MNLDKRIEETMNAMFLYTDDEKYHVEQIKALIKDLLRECRPEPSLPGHTSPPEYHLGRINVTGEYEAKAEQLLGEKL